MISTDANMSIFYFQPKNSLNLTDSKYAELMDLDMDSHWLILDDLALADLITLSEVNRHLSHLVHNVLKVKFSHKTVIFASPYSTSRLNYSMYVQETADFIRIQNLPLASKLLHYFGYLVKNVKIDEYLLDERSNAIITMVAGCCARTLNGIWLRNAKVDFKDCSKPFERVHKVELDGDLRNFADLKYNLSELFPAMSHFILNQVKFDDTKSIELEYPNLEWLEVDIFDKMVPGRVTENVVANIIRKNHQIKTLTLKNASKIFQKFIREELTNLQSLTNLVDDDDEDLFDILENFL